MSFNKYKKRTNAFNNFLKSIFFTKGLHPRKILFGKASGNKMYLDPLYKVQRILGLDEKEVQTSFLNFSRVCDTFFDIGASDGYYSLFYKKINRDGKAYLFDTETKLNEIQTKNFTLNGISSGYELFLRFVSNKNDDYNISLNSFNKKDEKLLFKIDVEGNEMVVLTGMNNLLENNNCYLIIETHSVQLERDCIQFLTSKNYQTHIIKNGWWRLIVGERRPLYHNRWISAYKI
jgi:hypothetical protein